MKFLFICALTSAVGAEVRTVVITGATGQTGSTTYLSLKKQGVNVRALVRNASKAKTLLGCSKCDESEGIFVGDITVPSSMSKAMAGADSLIMATGVVKGENSKDIIFDGIENQVKAFLSSPGPAPQDRHVMLISTQETTLLDTIFNKILAQLWGGWANGFYFLNAEAFLMNANVPYTIIKCCGLSNDPASQQQLLVGHDDKGWSFKDYHTVSRNDLARVLTAAATNPTTAANLRFDFCAKPGEAQADALDVLQEAMFSWDVRKKKQPTVAV